MTTRVSTGKDGRTRVTEVEVGGKPLLAIYDNPERPGARVALRGPRGGFLANVDLPREEILDFGRAIVTQYQPVRPPASPGPSWPED